MNWNTQFESMMNGWADTQKKVFDSYLSSVQGVNQSQQKYMWESMLAMGEEMLKNILKTQVQGLSAWVDGLGKTENVPAQVIESARQYLEMAERWNKIQSETIEKWFSMLKKFVPSSLSTDWTGQDMFKTWQETSQNIMDSQAKWMNTWKEQSGKGENG